MADIPKACLPGAANVGDQVQQMGLSGVVSYRSTLMAKLVRYGLGK